MYPKFLALKSYPFTDAGYELFYAYHSHQNALNTPLVALNNSEGFIKIVGEVGTGKTLLAPY